MSQVQPPQQQQQQQQRSGYVEEADDRSDIGSEFSTVSNASRRRKNRRKNQKYRANQLAAINQGQVAQQPGGGQVAQQGGKSGGKDAMSLRLDINLEAELTLRVKVHGDITLALLS